MDTRKRILVVEDEDAIARGLRFNFEQEGYLAIVCRDGPTALTHFASGAPVIDLVVLDLMLPGMSGYEICREIRVKSPHVPILVLSARTLSEDRAHAFDVGKKKKKKVDQYMTQTVRPAGAPQPLPEPARPQRPARAGSDRPPWRPSRPGPYRFRNVEVDPRTFEVRSGETVHQLTTMEMQLLRYFLDHPGEVLPRAQILRDVWDQSGRDHDPLDRQLRDAAPEVRRTRRRQPPPSVVRAGDRLPLHSRPWRHEWPRIRPSFR